MEALDRDLVSRKCIKFQFIEMIFKFIQFLYYFEILGLIFKNLNIFLDIRVHIMYIKYL